MTDPVPEYVTHYYLPDRLPFRNLSDLDDGELRTVLAGLNELRPAGLRRVFGRRYMNLRRMTEAKLIELFAASGGRPQRRAPHCFVLGTCEWYRRLFPSMKSVRIDVRDLPNETVSFTYPDSFTAMGFAPEFGLPYEPRPYHGRVFRIDELASVIGEFGLPDGAPDDDYAGYERRPFEKYIEVQLWSDELLALASDGIEEAAP